MAGPMRAYYRGTCPSHDPDGYGLAVKLTHRGPVAYPPRLYIHCPIEAIGGEPCPDGGRHVLTEITAEEYDRDDD